MQCIWTFSCYALWVKFSADDILKYFSYFSQKTGFDILCTLSPMQTICMTLRKQAYPNVLKNLPPKNENFQIKILIFFMFLLKP